MWTEYNFFIRKGAKVDKITPTLITKNDNILQEERVDPRHGLERGIIFFPTIDLAKEFLEHPLGILDVKDLQVAYLLPADRQLFIQQSVEFWKCTCAFLWYKKDGKWIRDTTEVRIHFDPVGGIQDGEIFTAQ